MTADLDMIGVCALLRREVAAAGSQRAFAVRHRISEQTVSAVLRGVRAPEPMLLRALGLKRVVRYAPVRSATEARPRGDAAPRGLCVQPEIEAPCQTT